MSRARGGLGRGLGALIPTAPAAPPPPAPPESATPVVAIPGPGYPSDGPAQQPARYGAGELTLSPVPGARFAEIPVGSIAPNPKQPRSVFDDEALEELRDSIEQVGFLQPIVVRELGADKYEL